MYNSFILELYMYNLFSFELYMYNPFFLYMYNSVFLSYTFSYIPMHPTFFPVSQPFFG